MDHNRLLEKYNGLKLGWLHDTLFFIVLLVAIFVVFRFLIGFAIVGGSSMEPSLYDGNVVVYNRMVRDYQPGDVVSMRVPAGDFYVKRVVATDGDVVDIRDGEVYVNGEQLVSDQAFGETREEMGAVIYPYTIRERNVFVLGDNREVSMDSRAFGEVNCRQIKGKIFFAFGKGGARSVP